MKTLEQIKRYANGEYCYDCGSEFEGHHTPLCAFSEETDERHPRKARHAARGPQPSGVCRNAESF